MTRVRYLAGLAIQAGGLASVLAQMALWRAA